LAISGISGIQSINALPQVSKTGSSDSSGTFQSMLSDAIDQASQTDAEDQSGAQALVTGDVNNLADSLIQSQKAEIALDLTVQIRNKVIDAYNEVMHMQV
jgi:flagellar hook-basal body complex protein FliE